MEIEGGKGDRLTYCDDHEDTLGNRGPKTSLSPFHSFHFLVQKFLCPVFIARVIEEVIVIG